MYKRAPARVIQTSRGALGYAPHGAEQEAAVILCHGTGGGYECLVSHHRETASILNSFLRKHNQ